MASSTLQWQTCQSRNRIHWHKSDRLYLHSSHSTILEGIADKQQYWCLSLLGYRFQVDMEQVPPRQPHRSNLVGNFDHQSHHLESWWTILDHTNDLHHNLNSLRCQPHLIY